MLLRGMPGDLRGHDQPNSEPSAIPSRSPAKCFENDHLQWTNIGSWGQYLVLFRSILCSGNFMLSKRVSTTRGSPLKSQEATQTADCALDDCHDSLYPHHKRRHDSQKQLVDPAPFESHAPSSSQEPDTSPHLGSFHDKSMAQKSWWIRVGEWWQMINR